MTNLRRNFLNFFFRHLHYSYFQKLKLTPLTLLSLLFIFFQFLSPADSQLYISSVSIIENDAVRLRSRLKSLMPFIILPFLVMRNSKIDKFGVEHKKDQDFKTIVSCLEHILRSYLIKSCMISRIITRLCWEMINSVIHNPTLYFN